MNKTSIIVVAYDRLKISRHITSACLGTVQAYTDREEYELILIDNDPVGELNRKYNIIELDKHITIQDIGYAASVNMGVKLSTVSYPYICLLHNDVFVQEGWLQTLIQEMELQNGDVIMPGQNPYTREQIKGLRKGENINMWDDAGLMLMKRSLFEKMGGYDERFKAVYHQWSFGRRLREAKGIMCYTNKTIIIHIGATTLLNDENYFHERHNIESPFTQEV